MSLLLTFPHSSHTPTPHSHGEDGDGAHLDGESNAKLPTMLPMDSALLSGFPMSSSVDHNDDGNSQSLHLQHASAHIHAASNVSRPKRERRKRIPFDPLSSQQSAADGDKDVPDTEDQMPPAKRFATRKGRQPDRERHIDGDDDDIERPRQRRCSPDVVRSENSPNSQKRGKGRRKSVKGHKEEKGKKDEYSNSPPLSSRLTSNESPNIRSRRRRRSREREREPSESSRSNSDDSRSRSRSRSPSPPPSPSVSGGRGGRSARMRSEREKDATLLMLETASAHRKLTTDEAREYKKLKRRKQNREAAATSRQRKKAYMSTLEDRVRALRMDKVRLLERIQLLKKENDQLKKQVGQQVDDQDNDEFLQQMMEDRDGDSEEEKPARRSRTSPRHRSEARNNHHSAHHANHTHTQTHNQSHADADADADGDGDGDGDAGNAHDDSEQDNAQPPQRGAALEQHAETFEAAVAEDDEDEGASAIIDKFIGKSKRRRSKPKQMVSPARTVSKDKTHTHSQAQRQQEQHSEQARQHTTEVSEQQEHEQPADNTTTLEISVATVSEQDQIPQRAQQTQDDGDTQNRKANHSRERRVKREKSKKADGDSGASTAAVSSSTNSAILLEGQEVDDRSDLMADERGALAIIKTEANSHSSSDDEAMASTLASLSHSIHPHRVQQPQIAQSSLPSQSSVLERHPHHPQLSSSSSLTSTLSVGGSLAVGRPRSNQNTPSLSFYPSISLSPRFGSLNMPSPNSSSFGLPSPGTGVHTVTNTPPAFSLTSNANYASHTAAHPSDFSSAAAASSAAASQATLSAHIHPMPLNLPSPRLRETTHSLLALHSMQAQNHSHTPASALSSLALLSSSALSNSQSATLANSS